MVRKRSLWVEACRFKSPKPTRKNPPTFHNDSAESACLNQSDGDLVKREKKTQQENDSLTKHAEV